MSRALPLLISLWWFLGGAASLQAQYLALFVDGRSLEVAGVNVVGEDRVRLDLPEGGWMEIPLMRLQAVLEDTREEEVPPPAEPVCDPGWTEEDLPPGTPYRDEIDRAARQAGLHPWLVASVVDAESRFNRWAVSRAGARGLMQLMPVVWQAGGISDPHDVRANLEVGTRYLAKMLRRYDDLVLALAAYNAGPAVVDRHQGVPPYRETRRYISRVLGTFCPTPGDPA